MRKRGSMVQEDGEACNCGGNWRLLGKVLETNPRGRHGCRGGAPSGWCLEEPWGSCAAQAEACSAGPGPWQRARGRLRKSQRPGGPSVWDKEAEMKGRKLTWKPVFLDVQRVWKDAGQGSDPDQEEDSGTRVSCPLDLQSPVGGT